MQTWTQKLLIGCLVINTIVTLALVSLLWSVRTGIERVERDFQRVEQFVGELGKDATETKGKALDAYQRYQQWREKRDREREQR